MNITRSALHCSLYTAANNSSLLFSEFPKSNMHADNIKLTLTSQNFPLSRKLRDRNQKWKFWHLQNQEKIIKFHADVKQNEYDILHIFGVIKLRKKNHIPSHVGCELDLLESRLYAKNCDGLELSPNDLGRQVYIREWVCARPNLK